MDAKTRAEYKRRRTVAIKKLRDAGLSESEIQNALASIREELGVSGSESNERDSVENLPAVIDSADRQGSTRHKSKTFPPKPNRDENNRSTNKENVAQYDSMLAENPERRCVGTNQLGEQCRNFAIKGGRVCKFHGGATRHVKDKARIRVEMASNALMGKLIEIAFDDNRPASVQLEAIKDSLNRAGLTKPNQVEVGPARAFDNILEDLAFSGIQHEPSESVNPSGLGVHDGMGSIDGQGDSPIYSYVSADASNQADYQRDSMQVDSSPGQSHPAPVDGYRAGERARRHSDCDGLAARRTASREFWDRQYRRADHVTGEDAIEAANAANFEAGAIKALPPGRKRRD